MSDTGRPTNAAYGIGLAAFATVLYVALVVAGFGVVSLLVGSDPIPERDAGPILGPVMIGVSVILLGASMVGRAIRGSHRGILLASVVVGVVCWLAYALSGGALYALESRQLVTIALFSGAHLFDAYAVMVGVFAAAVHLVFALLLERNSAGGARPEWPWEKDEDE